MKFAPNTNEESRTKMIREFQQRGARPTCPAIIPYWPWIMANPPAIPKLYYGAISVEQRDLELCKKIAGIEAYLKYLSAAMIQFSEDLRAETQAMIDEFEAKLEDAIEGLQDDLQEQIRQLIQWVQEQTFSVQMWDVTRGRRTDSIDGMRRLFFDVTVHGMTVEELANNTIYSTVEDLAESGWNCRAIAVIGAKIFNLEETDAWLDQWRPTN